MSRPYPSSVPVAVPTWLSANRRSGYANLRTLSPKWICCTSPDGPIDSTNRGLTICELAPPNGFFGLPQTVQLTRQTVVVPMECQVIDLRIAAAVRRAVG